MIIAINASGGGSDSGLSGNGIVEKNYTLELSKKIANNLQKRGIQTILLRDNDSTISYEQRLKNLKNKVGNEKVLLLSNTLNNDTGTDIIYALRNTDKLASELSKSLDYFNTTKYYQLRYPSDTSKDYYYITRETPNYETIIIRYGNPTNSKDASVLKNVDEIAESVADVLANYVGVSGTKPATPTTNTYVVKSGDTLYSIAKKFNISVEKLKDINNLNSNLIKINQELVIPNKTHVVVKGDTLYSIAKKNNTTVDELMKINNLKNSNLSIGDILYLP